MAKKGETKDFCKRGHPRTPENLCGRSCILCRDEKRKRGSTENEGSYAGSLLKGTCKNGHLRTIETVNASGGCKLCQKDRQKTRDARFENRDKEYCLRGHLRTSENITKTGNCRECTAEKVIERILRNQNKYLTEIRVPFCPQGHARTAETLYPNGGCKLCYIARATPYSIKRWVENPEKVRNMTRRTKYGVTPRNVSANDRNARSQMRYLLEKF